MRPKPLPLRPDVRQAEPRPLLRLRGATFLLNLALPLGVVVTARARITRERDP